MKVACHDECASVEKVLVSVCEAQLIATSFAPSLGRTETIPLGDAFGRSLAEPARARLALPPFDQSAMDGYAFAAASVENAESRLSLAGRIEAGSRRQDPLPLGAAVRIFTGAPIPEGADTVVMQEHVVSSADSIVLKRRVQKSANIRWRGEDVMVGELLLDAGTILDARHIALLAAQGMAEVKVAARPRVAVLSCGSELHDPDRALQGGAIFDSNRPMLLALVRQAGCEGMDGGCVHDDPAEIGARLRILAQTADMIVCSGGASVGDKDFCAAAAAEAGGFAQSLKIAMKPGKPAVVGRICSAAFIGLPGNPVAALVSWLLLGQAMAAKLSGRSEKARTMRLPCASAFEHKPGRTSYLPARLVAGPQGPQLEIVGRGGSARLMPLVDADGFIEVPATQATVTVGEPISFHPFFSDLLPRS